MIIGIICTALGLAGVVGIFLDIIWLVVLGGIADILENAIVVISGAQNNLFFIGLAIVIGIVWATSTGHPIWFGVLVGACWESTISAILTVILFSFAKIKAKA